MSSADAQVQNAASDGGFTRRQAKVTIWAAVIAALASAVTGVLTFMVQQEQNDIRAEQLDLTRDLGEREADLEEELGRREAALEDLQIRDEVRLRNLERKERLIQQYLPLILDEDPDTRGHGIAALLSLMNEEEWQAVGRAIEQVDPTVEEDLPDFFIDQQAVAAIDWAVTLGGYDSPDEASEVAEQVEAANFTPIRLYRRGEQTFVAIAPIDTESEAEVQLRLAARRLPFSGTLVRLDDWCPSPRSIGNGDTLECVAQIPDLFGQGEREAIDTLNDLGFDTLVKRACSPDVERGRVFGLVTGVTSDERPRSDSIGETVLADQTVSVFVSSGQCSEAECLGLDPEDIERVNFESGQDRGNSEFVLDDSEIKGFELSVAARQLLQVSLTPNQSDVSVLMCIFDPSGTVQVATSALQATTPPAARDGDFTVLVANLGEGRSTINATFVVPPMN